MAFGQNPGALFIGTLSPDDKAFVASVLKAALDDGYEKVVEPFVEALQATKKYGDVKNAGAAVWLMTRAALRQFGEDDGRACTPIMKLFGRAAIPTTTYEGVKSIIERKTKAGEISQPWEIFENMLGETYGARRRKAD